MPKRFVSDWIKFATAGPTIDGREITDQQLEDMAELYDPEEYQAKLWYDHYRFYGSAGDVTALKTEKDDKNRTCLFGKVAPATKLIELVRGGHYLHCSIERVPNFNKTDKWYLGGLGVTDNPASLGVGKQMQFSAQQMFSGRVNAEHDLSDFIPFELSVDDEDERLFQRFSNFLKKHSNEEPEMKEEQFNELEKKVESLADSFNKFLETFNKEEDKEQVSETATPETGSDTSQEFASNEQLEELNKKLEAFSGLAEQFKNLQEQFKNAVETPADDQEEDDHTGDDDFNKKEFI